MRRLTACGAVVAVAAAGMAFAPGGAVAAGPAQPQGRDAAMAAARAEAPVTARELGLDSRESLVVKDVITDADGTTHTRYDRTFDGLRVVGGDLVVHRDRTRSVKGQDRAHSGALAVSRTAKVSRASAEAKGKAAAADSDNTPRTATGEQIVWAAASGAPRLAYDVVVDGVRDDQTPSRVHSVVDANTGAVLAEWDDIKTGTGNSQYAGTVTIGTSLSGSTYQMKDNTRGGGYTTDLNGGTTGTGTTFTDADDVWGTGSPTNRQTAGVDAHYGAQVTWDYYKNVHGRNGIFNNGTGVRSRVHYGNAYVNAFWDGTQMTYGDGAGNAKPLTSIDVAGHEMTHGVTENSANLTYSGESGGLNEATSDIFGAATEFAANNASDAGDYLIGEKIDINGNGTPLRYMDQPSKDGVSKDCWYSGIGAIDVHHSSGPANHWFYLASEGSGAKTINGVSYNSPTCNGGTVTGITRDAAAKIWYRALTVYMTSSTNYAGARTATLKAAKDLYGTTSSQCTTVASAWNAISVPAGTETCGTTPPPTGTNLLANPGFESGAVSWTGTAGPITNNTGRPARTGTWKMWLGGNGATSTEYEQQAVTISATAAAPTLSFWLRTDTAETGTTAYDTMKVQVVDGATTTTLATYSNVGTNATYTQKSFSLAAYKGRTVTVKFLLNEDSSLQTSFVVDDTSVTIG